MDKKVDYVPGVDADLYATIRCGLISLERVIKGICLKKIPVELLKAIFAARPEWQSDELAYVGDSSAEISGVADHKVQQLTSFGAALLAGDMKTVEACFLGDPCAVVAIVRAKGGKTRRLSARDAYRAFCTPDTESMADEAVRKALGITD